MAIDRNGRIKGSIGNVVHYNLGDKNIMRLKPGYMHNPRTPKQQNHRAKIRLSGRFNKAMIDFIKIGYQATSLDYPSNEARQYIIKNCFIETPQGMVLDYPSILVSRGELNMPEEFSMTADGSAITVKWKTPVKNDGNDGMDKVMIAMYMDDTPLGQSWLHRSVALRREGTATVPIPPHNSPVHVWMFYYNAEKALGESRKKISDSVYLGEL